MAGKVVARQATRYKYEKKELRKTFGDCVSFFEESGRLVQVELQANTNQQHNDYTLRIYLPVDYPSSCPFLVVSKPEKPLEDFFGNVLGASYENHCLGPKNQYGLTAICHCRPDCWENSMTTCDVFMKGLKWLEAYEIMLKTGEDIEAFLSEMPMSQERTKEVEKLRKKVERDLKDLMEQGDPIDFQRRLELESLRYHLSTVR